MEFRTEVKPLKHHGEITHSSQIMLTGSCFSDEIGNRLRRDGFNVCANPFGTLYNPESIAAAIIRIAKGEEFSTTHMARRVSSEDEEIWCNLLTSSLFNSSSPEETLQRSNEALRLARDFLLNADFLFITLGTAVRYELKDRGITVANCHKFPAKIFAEHMMSVNEIVRQLNMAIDAVREINPNLRLIFTVSPNRYKAYGLHGSQLSKARLMLAIEQLENTLTEVEYFPAYEAVVDDLRDYRFYAADMSHPSDQAAEYVYELFQKSYFDRPTEELARKCRCYSSMLAHRKLSGIEDVSFQKTLESKRTELCGSVHDLSHFIK